MHLVIKAFICTPLFCTSAWAVELATAPPATNSAQQAPATQASIRSEVASVAQPSVVAKDQRQQSTVGEESKPLTAEQIAKQKATMEAKAKALVKDQATRLQQLEKANLDALSQNQELQLKNDSLGVQVQVLQSERSAQMFLYGAATIAVGIFLGFLIASYIYTKRRRQW